MTENTLTPAENTLVHDPALSETDAARLVAESRAASSLSRGEPPGLATLETAVEGIKQKIDAASADLARLPEGDPRKRDLVDRILSLTAEQLRLESHRQTVATDAETRRETQAQQDVLAALPALAPQEVQSEPWLGPLIRVAASHGLQHDVAPLLYTALSTDTRRTWTDQECVSDLIERFGEVRAERIIASAEQMSATFPKPFVAWLRERDLLANPELVEQAAKTWDSRARR